MLKRISIFIVFVLAFSVNNWVFSQNNSDKNKFAIKVVPAFFWNTYGLNAEYRVAKKVALGANFQYYMGTKTVPNPSVNTGAYLNKGWSADIIGKYYFSKKKRMEGLYVMANVSYNTILYFDGNTRPYTLQNHWRDKANDAFIKANPFNAGIGIGYQALIWHRLVADVNLNFQFQMHSEKGLYTSIFSLPSIGLMF